MDNLPDGKYTAHFCFWHFLSMSIKSGLKNNEMIGRQEFVKQGDIFWWRWSTGCTIDCIDIDTLERVDE